MFPGLQRIIIDPAGYVVFEFFTFDQRADFLCLIPHGEIYGNTRYNTTDEPPYRVTFQLDDFKQPFIIEAAEAAGEEGE